MSENVEPLSVVVAAPAPASVGSDFDLQRAIDLVLTFLALLFLLPLMSTIALAVWLSDRGPVFFGHNRVGHMGQTFRCWKFRSMAVDGEKILEAYLEESPLARAEWERDHKLRNDPRITPLGRLLRKTSLDELPQLWNVLIGEMSLVGPRPIVVAEIPRYKSYFEDYCRCRPGITGLWQISGRNDVTYDQRVALDVRYARTRSTWLNLSIMINTIPAVLLRKGSY